ncbi:alpha/beta hydrolase [Mesorhizobium sp.]|uniref:alpha/beta fold hydrolase n=1 Tax=Mesorhizobium sp. TaxID=1871066 RepID=UPI000FE737A6|nr:alpha/beta hydrolase [Mesorhizobium sp.]RWP27771.1 MAG: alpha/beta hydrolase [Mesorhizobium sp.]
MSRSMFFAFFASAAALFAAPGASNAEDVKPSMTSETKAMPKPAKSGLLPINGLNHYYAAYGRGEPLLLLHGGLGTTDMFAPILPKLAESRTVIGVDLHGHGRTALGDRPLSLEAMGDDMAAIVKALGYDKVDVMGYSLGGGVAFRMAVQHPETVRRLVLVSTGYASDGFYADMRTQQAQVGAAMADMMKDTPMYKSYVAVAPRPQDFPKLLDQLGTHMRKDYDYSADVAKLKMPVMLVFGDSDMYRPEHEIKFYQMLGGGLKDAGWMRENLSQNRLAILPNRTHYDVFFAPELVAAALPFLNGETKVKTWDEVISETE